MTYINYPTSLRANLTLLCVYYFIKNISTFFLCFLFPYFCFLLYILLIFVFHWICLLYYKVFHCFKGKRLYSMFI